MNNREASDDNSLEAIKSYNHSKRMLTAAHKQRAKNYFKTRLEKRRKSESPRKRKGKVIRKTSPRKPKQTRWKRK